MPAATSTAGLEGLVRGKLSVIRAAAHGRLASVAEEALSMMQARLDRGVMTNQRRPSYAPSTARRKGRRQPVTLRSDGRGPHMRDELHVRRESESPPSTAVVSIRLKSREKIRVGRILQARYGWFGLTVRETRRLLSRYDAHHSETAPRSDRRFTQTIEIRRRCLPLPTRARGTSSPSSSTT
jgi:hypothetical protein